MNKKILSLNSKKDLLSVIVDEYPVKKMKYRMPMADGVRFKLDYEWDNVDIDTTYCSIKSNIMTIKSMFAWDGASGVKDTVKSVIASMFHDAGYRLIRKKLLSIKFKGILDNMFKRVLEVLGENKIISFTYWLGLKVFGRAIGLNRWKKWVKFW